MPVDGMWNWTHVLVKVMISVFHCQRNVAPLEVTAIVSRASKVDSPWIHSSTALLQGQNFITEATQRGGLPTFLDVSMQLTLNGLQVKICTVLCTE